MRYSQISPPEPPDWPEPEVQSPPAAAGTVEFAFETTWGSNLSANALEEGAIHSLSLNGSDESTEDIGVFAGHSSAQEAALLADVDEPASIVAASVDDDGSVSGLTLVLDLNLLSAGAALVIEADAIAGGIWTIAAGSSTPEEFSPFSEGTLELSKATTTPGGAIAGTFSGVYGYGAATPGDVNPESAGSEP